MGGKGVVVHLARGLLCFFRVIVKSGVQAVESSGDLIDPCHLDTIFKFNCSNHLGQIVEST